MRDRSTNEHTHTHTHTDTQTHTHTHARTHARTHTLGFNIFPNLAHFKNRDFSELLPGSPVFFRQ